VVHLLRNENDELVGLGRNEKRFGKGEIPGVYVALVSEERAIALKPRLESMSIRDCAILGIAICRLATFAC